MQEIKCLTYQTDFYMTILVFAPSIILKILFCPFIFLPSGKLCPKIIRMSLQGAAIKNIFTQLSNACMMCINKKISMA